MLTGAEQLVTAVAEAFEFLDQNTSQGPRNRFPIHEGKSMSVTNDTCGSLPCRRRHCGGSDSRRYGG
ncbi:hypothetical protein I553_10762 [Mycobacterium xenopi 4042]|uniref:Uncharacterized protein n=1 Tax=Mycobacterium xenopi 4042 TaxID=1299334 RepID=X8DD91_MYCXE|nr:hypothetical protein I552_0525 [Mycobacterium xenopi 3993]EUA65465.1 hypothetical protein I553_10762 [Mycobacterium xenopi 4042]